MVQIDFNSLKTTQVTLDSGPIFLIEEDPDNANEIKHAFKDLKVACPLIHIEDGEEALVRLLQQGEKPPWLILLNVGLQESKGIAFLNAIKSDNTLKLIPVILMATSCHQSIITECFRLGAAGYMIISGEQSQLVETIRTIIHYWTLCAWPPN